MFELSLVVPGLLGPLPELSQQQLDLPECRVLRRWLARGNRQRCETEGYYTQIGELMQAGEHYSVALASAPADGIKPDPQGYWYRADAVHFQTDIDHAILIHTRMLEIQNDEARQLAESFNAHFEEQGLQLLFSASGHGYLRSDTPVEITSTPLEQAVGRNVRHFLPHGADELRWRKILNECQMLFHGHEVNQLREKMGRPSINSLWLWGEGLPVKPSTPGWSVVYASDAIARGLCGLLALPGREPQQFLHDAANLGGRVLLVLDDLYLAASNGDPWQWRRQFEDLCEHWLEPIHSMLSNQLMQRLTLYPTRDARYICTPSLKYKFWRRQPALIDYLE